jgi:hypothetical protein
MVSVLVVDVRDRERKRRTYSHVKLSRCSRSLLWCLWCLFEAEIGSIHGEGLKELK